MFNMNEPVFRALFSLTLFAALAVAETVSPRRSLTVRKRRRWTMNLLLTGVNPLILRILFPLVPFSFAVICSQKQWGLFNVISIPVVSEVIISVVILDLILYLQHVAFHRFPLLWRFHLVHHADMDIDVTTGLRFHPIEAALSMIIKLLAVAVIGPPALAVLIFEILLNGASMFNHSNLNIPLWADRMLRLFIVTPDMHRVHHSVIIKEMDSNFGFNIPWWDRFFGTYKAQPVRGHDGMKIGVGQFQDQAIATIPWILKLPFTAHAGRNAAILDRQRKGT